MADEDPPVDSILNSIKKTLGIELDYDGFDSDIILAINTSIMTLNQLGIGEDSFIVEDVNDVWSDFLGDATNLEGSKTYISLSVKIIFDPPSSSFVLEALKNQKEELAWRLAVQVENAEDEDDEEE